MENGNVKRKNFGKKKLTTAHTLKLSPSPRGKEQASDTPEGARVSAAALELRLGRASSEDKGCGPPVTTKQEL